VLLDRVRADGRRPRCKTVNFGMQSETAPKLLSVPEHRGLHGEQRPLSQTGRLIREARLATGMSLRELARRIEVSPGTLSAIETGKTPVTVDRLERLATNLGLSTFEILTGPSPQLSHAGASDNAIATLPVSPWREFAPLSMDPALAAAVETFVATGYHAANMRTIAAAAHMSVAGVYHYYPSKQHLLVASFDLSLSELIWRIPAARNDGQNPSERFANMVEALALFHTHRRDLAILGATEMRSLEEPDRSRIILLRNEIQYLLDEGVTEGLRSGDFTTPHPHAAARAIATMCTSLPQWFRTGGPLSQREIAVEYAHFAVTILRQASR
jgi:AcrR family transcriptional regulator/transcriptional regulator with XRE-family HTH domain